MKRKMLSLITAISILMGTIGVIPVSADYSADSETGTHVWDFAEFAGENAKTGASGIQTYDYEGLKINIGNNDKINETGVVWSGGGGVLETNRHIAYTPSQDGTLYVTGTMSTKNERWGITDLTGSLIGDSSSTTSTAEATVQRTLTAKQTYYIYARNSAKLTVSNLRYVTTSGKIETPDPNATEEPADPTPNPEDVVMSIVEDATGDSTEIDTFNLYTDDDVTKFAVTTADSDGNKIATTKVNKASSVTVDTSGAAKVEIVPVFGYDNIGSVQSEKTLRTDVENGLYNFTFKKGGTKRVDIYVNGAMVANNVDKDGYNRNSISSGSEISVNDIAITGGSVRVQTLDGGNSDAYKLSTCEFYKAPTIVDRVKKVYVIGDSLVADYYGTPKSSINIAQAGWGQVIDNFFTNNVEVVNLANGGHYATILETTAFPGVIANAKAGDYLIMESGYNDTKHNTADETRESVERMVAAAKEKGIIPIVVSPNASMEDEGVSNYVESIRYTEAMRQAATNTNAYFVDLSKGSYDFYRANYGDDTDAIKNTYYFPTEKTPDLLHHNYLGAMNCARIVAQGMYDLGIKDFINTDFEFTYTDAAENEITLKIDTTKTDDPTPPDNPTPPVNPTEGIKATAELSDGTYTVTADAGDKQGIMIAASYKDGRLTSVKTADYTGQPVTLELTPSDGADRIKVMLWSSLEEMEPIYPAKELEAESTKPTDPTDIIDEPEPLENEAEVMDLAGEWGLKLASYTDGLATDDTCALPGTLSENSKGTQNTKTDKTKLSLKYTYTGDAVYQKKVTIPADWEDKSVTLSMERTKLTRVWVNGVEETSFNTSNSIVVPHEYYLENLVPGQENTITVQVTNGTGSNEGKADNVYGLFRTKTHMLTAETQTDWNGIIGDISLKAADKIYIKDVMVYPDAENHNAKVKVVVQNDTAAAVSGKITLAAESYNHSGAADTVAPAENNSNFAIGESTLEFTYNMGDNPRLWSEFHPALYRMAVSLEAGGTKSDYSENFGMRDWGTSEGQFTINGNKTFLRGEANSAVFPENGYPYMTKTEWITFFKKAQSMGINFFRFHSWIPPMAAFEAADELGIYMQPEMYGFGGTPTDNDFNNTLYGQDGINAVRYLASNPSFVMMTFGNEMNTTSEPVEAFRAKIKAVDPTRLYAGGTNNNLSVSEINTNDDFWTTAKVGLGGHDQQIRLSFAWNNDAEGGRLEGEQPNSAQTFDNAVAYLNSDIPVMGHETGQYQVLPKFDQEIARYNDTVFAPRNLSNFKSIMNNKGLLYMNDKFSEATARTSAIQYRADIEAAIKTNKFGGYQLLSIQDFPGQNTALVGILDSFMMDKDGGFTSDEYKSFNSPVTTLAKIPKYMYNTTDAFTAEAVIANYTESAINGAAAKWSIKTENGTVIKEGTLAGVNAPQGQVTSLGTINEASAFTGITKAQKLTFTISAADSKNSYSIWVYPEKTEEKPNDLLIADAYTKEVRDTLEAGGKVLMIPTPDTTNLPNSVSVRWTNDYWSSMFHGRVAGAATTMGLYMDTANPVFNDFPTESFSDYQWFNLMKNSRAVILDDAGSDFEPIVWNIDHMAYSRKLGSIFEAKVGEGKLLVCTMDVLNQMKTHPEARQMYNSLVEYASSCDFNPAKSLTADYLKTIFKPVINSTGTVSAYEEIGGWEYSWSQTKSDPKAQSGTDENGSSVTNAAGGISADDMLRYDNVFFSGNGSTKMIVSAANGGSSGDDAIIEVYLDSGDGEKIATLNFANTGGWDKFKKQEFIIPHMWGTQNILLKFTNANICLNYITFEESTATYRNPYELIDPSNTSAGAISFTDNSGASHEIEQLTAKLNGAVTVTIPNCDFGFDGAAAVKIGGSVLNGDTADVTLVYTDNGEEQRIPITFKMNDGEEYALESGTTSGTPFWRNTVMLPSEITGVHDISFEFADGTSIQLADITFMDKSALNSVWDFARYTDGNAVTATGDQTVNYDGLEIHLAANDTVTTGGVVWNSPKTNTSDNKTTLGNNLINRYIKYTPSNDGTLTLTFQGDQWGSSSKAPRMYIVTSEVDMNKNAGDAAKMSATATAKDKDTTLTASLTAGTTYYIWPYYYGSSTCVFTVSDMAFTPAEKAVSTRNIYGSNMLLQRGEPVVIDGKADAADKVTVTLTNTTTDTTVQTVTTDTTSQSGAWYDKDWTVTLNAVSDYNSTYKLTVSADGAEDIVYDNILFGDQYIFSGQSNMWMSVDKYKNIDKDAYAEAAVNQHLTDKIRLMYTPGESDYGTNVLQYNAQNIKPWRDFSSYANVKDVGAPAYTAAVKLYEETGVPIGVIDNPYPGSYISSWFDSALALDNCNLGKNGTSNERNWYCGRIYPLRNLKLSGIFWYQGEADAATKYHDKPYDYYLEMMPKLITSWRELFNDSDLPFYYTQLSRIGSTIVDENNSDTGASGKMPIKLAQTDAYLNMTDKTNVGIVSTLDLYGNHDASGQRNCRTDIHLAQKQFVGDRMANLALVDIYKKTKDKNNNTVYRMGPLYKSSEVKDGTIVVTFNCNGQLKIMPSSQYTDTTGEQKITDGEFNPAVLNEFELAGEDGTWYAATAVITGTDKVTVSSTDVPAPVKVRYCGKDYPESPNLTDDSGLPSYVFEKTATPATEQPQQTQQPQQTEAPQQTTIPMPEVLATYKFDFIAEDETGDNDSYPVTKDSEYNTTFTEDGLQYGLYGANENDYKLANYVDGVTTVQGQVATYIEGEDCIGAYKVTGEEASGQAGYGQIAGLYPIRFSMAGENGAYYRIKVTLKGLDKTKDAEATLFSERRHPIITNETIPAGESKTVEFTATLQNVAIKNRSTGTTDTYKDNKVNIVAVGENVAIDKIEIYKVAHQPTIFMYDDSTGCDYAMLQPYFTFQNYGGTGQFFSKYLNEGIAVANQGDGGINAADNAHWNAAKSSISAGDYVYVQYGHNHKNDGPKGYVQSLNKYYDYAHEAGAYTILAGPIDRHNSSQYTAGTNTWSSTLSGYSTAAEYFTKLMILRGPDTVTEFVTKVKASSSKNIDASVYAWADEEIAKGLDEENGRNDIAFVDLNAPTLSWLSEVCDTVKTQRGQSSYSASYTNYYFRSVNGSSVDGTHPNDAGADNTAYFFFAGAKEIVNAENKDAVKTVEAAVLAPLVENMRNATPLQAPEELVKLGGAPNSAWPMVYKSSNAANYPTAVKAIEWNEDGTIDSVSIVKQESKMNMDAYGILELKIFDKNETLKGTVYSTQVDNTWDDGSLVRFSLDEDEATNRLTGDTTTVYDETAGDTFTAVIWRATDNGDGLKIYVDEETNKPVQYSEYYKEDDGSGELITNEDGNAGEDFNFYGAIYSAGNASNLHGNNGWLVNGSNSKNTLLGKDGERYYANIESTGSSGSFLVYKKLTAETLASGSISFSMDLQYNNGSSLYIGVGNGIKSGSPWVNNRLNLLTIDKNSTDTTGNTANVKVTDGSTAKTVGTIGKDTWTTVTGTLDMDNGTLTVKVGDGEQVTASVANYDTINTALTPSSLTAFFIRIADKTAAGIKMSNLSVTRNAAEALPDKTLTISSSDTNSGTVSIEGTNELTLTAVQNSAAAIKATAKTENDKFLGWYEGETLISEDETLTLRLHRNLTLEARFKNLSAVTITSAVNNAEYGSVTINGSEETSASVNEDDTLTLRAISKTGYKFVNWTKDGSEVAKTPSYTITAGSSNENYTANFTSLAARETV